jgi:phosphopantetheine adenylyltransferase
MDKALNKIGPAFEQVHETYQRLLNLDAEEAHYDNYAERQDITGKEHNNLIIMADEVLSNSNNSPCRATLLQQRLQQCKRQMVKQDRRKKTTI